MAETFNREVDDLTFNFASLEMGEQQKIEFASQFFLKGAEKYVEFIFKQKIQNEMKHRRDFCSLGPSSCLEGQRIYLKKKKKKTLSNHPILRGSFFLGSQAVPLTYDLDWRRQQGSLFFCVAFQLSWHGSIVPQEEEEEARLSFVCK